ncbi:MAG: hypothetical protein V1913_06025 [Fibrobacterota bacterium]
MERKETFLKTMVHTRAEVLFESGQAGYAANYTRVRAITSVTQGRITEVQITGIKAGTLLAGA